jgi:hypothetical protein
MSRWLKSVGNLLDGLDGTAENINQLVPTSRGAIGQILSRRGYEEEESYSEGDEEWDEDDDEYEEIVEEEVVDLDVQPAAYSQPLFPSVHVPVSEPPPAVLAARVDETPKTLLAVPTVKNDPMPLKKVDPAETAPKTTPLPPVARVNEKSETVIIVEDDKTEELTANPAQPKPNSSRVDPLPSPPPPAAVVAQQPTEEATKHIEPTVPAKSATVPAPPPIPVETVAQNVPKIVDTKAATVPPFSGNSSTVMVETPPVSGNYVPNTQSSASANAMIAQLQRELKKYKVELKKHKTEAQSLRKHVLQLNKELESTETEVQAQREELERAAERMEKDRSKHNEDREELMDEHDEELEQLKEQYEQQLADQKDQFEDQIEELEERLSSLDEKRTQEGGDWTKELEDSVQREREAIKKLSEIKSENVTMKSTLSKVQTQQAALQAKLEVVTQSLQVAYDREREAEDKLDAAKSAHTRQLGQRQSREAELERTIADLGAALNMARQKEKNAVSEVRAAKKMEVSSNYKEQFEMTFDELESLRAQYVMETQRYEALMAELEEISRERAEETAEAQGRHRLHDRELSELRAQLKRLQQQSNKSSTPSVENDASDAVMTMVKEAERYQQQLTEMSDELFKQQRKVERSKSEILALKGRVTAEQARAEAAEIALSVAQSSSNAFDVEGGSGIAYGGAKMRRRVKGGRGGQAMGVNRARSISSALDMAPGRVSENMEPVAMTIDALDSFVLDTGSLLRQEPLARLFCLFYLFILHLWSFCLVIFHTHSYEQVHGDLGTLSETGGFGPASLMHTHGHMPDQP